MLKANIVPKKSNTSNLIFLDKISKYFRFFLLLLFANTLASCTGMREAVNNVPTTPVAQGQSRIILNRAPSSKSDTDSLYSALSARISINGKKVGEMSPGDIFSTDIDQGRSVIAIDNKGFPGKYSISLNAISNTVYKFDVSGRAESNAPGKFFGIFDMNAYGKSNDKSGLFKIVEVSAKERQNNPLLAPVNKGLKQKPINKSDPKPPLMVAPSIQKPIIQSKPIPAPSTGKQKLKLIKKTTRKLAPVKIDPKQKLAIQSKPTKPVVKPQMSPSQKRLIELKKLLDEELITQKDYNQKKRQILKGI
jgi:hypothetical protein